MKDHFPLQKVGSLLQKMLPALTHHCDGLVFTPNAKNAPYAATGEGGVGGVGGVGGGGVPPLLSWRGWQASKLGDGGSRGGSHVLPKQLAEYAAQTK
jgi:hypothetical protein